MIRAWDVHSTPDVSIILLDGTVLKAKSVLRDEDQRIFDLALESTKAPIGCYYWCSSGVASVGPNGWYNQGYVIIPKYLVLNTIPQLTPEGRSFGLLPRRFIKKLKRDRQAHARK